MPELIDAVDELVARSLDHPELRKFHTFHRRHPEVVDFLVTEIQLLIDHGREAFSFGSLWEYGRWTLEKKAAPGESFAMNDHLSPYFARTIVILHPDFNGRAEFRESTADRVFGTRVEPPSDDHKGRRRRLQWADGTPLELGWRPQQAHVLTRVVPRKRSIHD